MTITLKQFKKFAIDNDIFWYYNKPKWRDLTRGTSNPISLLKEAWLDEMRKIYKDGELDALLYWMSHGNWHKAIFEEQQKKEIQMKVNVEIAKICHEANRQYCIDNQLKTHAKWDKLPDEMQESVVAGVAKIVGDPKITAEEMHEAWVDYKAEEGWIYGDEIDAKYKTHPNMLKWKKLSKVERGKDKLFLATVKREMNS